MKVSSSLLPAFLGHLGQVIYQISSSTNITISSSPSTSKGPWPLHRSATWQILSLIVLHAVALVPCRAEFEPLSSTWPPLILQLNKSLGGCLSLWLIADSSRAFSLHACHWDTLVDSFIFYCMGVVAHAFVDHTLARPSTLLPASWLRKNYLSCLDCSRLVDEWCYIEAFQVILMSAWCVCSKRRSDGRNLQVNVVLSLTFERLGAKKAKNPWT